ncbi:C40 family peptidase [Nocardioides sp. LS1]|uniref:C40 family peptidase n=1 Tax=Nocardioides sp. LS1 TaxID=1027620 RepID=UPI000F622469|nr:C40 family peptidase [Nocardioides sp. LS1]GCD91986.1 peptidase P60 [Nocardioides sp. LS1]
MGTRIRVVVAAALLATATACGNAPAPPAARPSSSVASPATPTGSPAPSAPHPRAGHELAVGDNAWVAVAVARLWQSPSAPWPVDAPALRSPVRFRAWLQAMTLDQRRALFERSDTEALLGDRVVVRELRPRWVRVVVPSQPSQKARGGYPGWIPRRQLNARVPAWTAKVATVTRRTAWLRTDDAASARTTEVSAGTRLHVLGRTGHYLRVLTPRGEVRRLLEGVAVVRAPHEAALPATRTGLRRTARSFLGLYYLWGGLSGFGLDCSGLTWLDYRLHGTRIPRDALPQSQHGRRTAPHVGDLLFYASDGLVHHVSMYVGDGLMIHAPRTGEQVQVVSFEQEPLRSEYAGARRYLP